MIAREIRNEKVVPKQKKKYNTLGELEADLKRHQAQKY